MNIKRISHFKNPETDRGVFNEWVGKLEHANNRTYERHVVSTSIGKTHVWGYNTEGMSKKTLVIFPGARTTSLFWDLDNGLDQFGADLRKFLVETNGLPNLSDGATPDIKSDDYGIWAAEVFDRLKIDHAFVAGASFGGLIAMKLARVHPQKVRAAFLLNPGCLQSFSLSFPNLYYNILPIVRPTTNNVRKFLEKAIFCKPHHQLSPLAEQLLVDYELLALQRYVDKTQKPYYMNDELNAVTVDTYLLEGDHDLLFPYERSVTNAKKHLKHLKECKVFKNVGHGIETYPDALKYVGEKIRALS